MILVFELTWRDLAHAPINASMINIIERACPGHRIRVFAHSSHLRHLRRGATGDENRAVELVPVQPTNKYSGKTNIVSFTRFYRELVIILAAVRAAPAGEYCLLVLLSATSTAVWAAAFAACLSPRVRGIHVLLHGNLNDAVGWRTRNPLLRRFDLLNTLRSRLPALVRYVVFERNIVSELAKISRRASATADLVPHPVIPGDLAEEPDIEPKLGLPIRVGFVGQGTHSKGFHIFLDIATTLSARYPSKVMFHMIGKVPPPSLERALAAPLAEPATSVALSRDVFIARLRQLDFVMLPFQPGYYDLSASGGFLDAITWLKPVLASDIPLVRGLMAEYGDIGYADNDLSAVLERIIMSMDQARYANQVAALRRARTSRMPAALAPEYRKALLAGFPTFPTMHPSLPG